MSALSPTFETGSHPHLWLAYSAPAECAIPDRWTSAQAASFVLATCGAFWSLAILVLAAV